MKGQKAVVCVACGARNRPQWDFCARCNEPLEGATLAPGPAPSSVSGEGVGGAPSSVPAWGVAAVALLALGALGVAAWRSVAQAPPPDAPDPRLFTMATLPAEVPSAALPTAPGAADYEAGLRLLHQGDLGGAVSRLAAAVAASPENAEYLNVYGHALSRSGDGDGGLSAWGEAARLDRRYAAHYARALSRAGRTAEAVRQYEEVLAAAPERATIHEDLGRLLYRSGDYARAAAHLQRASEARADDPVLRQELAYALDQSGQKARAVALYKQVLEVAPAATISRGLLAQGLFDQGKRDEAVAVLRQGIEVTPQVPVLQRTLGSLLERSARPTEAAAAYRAYARMAPNAPDAREMLDRAARLEAGERTR